MDSRSLCFAELIVDTVLHAEEVVRDGLRERSPLLGFVAPTSFSAAGTPFVTSVLVTSRYLCVCARVWAAQTDFWVGVGGRCGASRRPPLLYPPRSGKEPRPRHGLGGRRTRRGRRRRQDPDEALPPALMSTLPAPLAEAPGTRQRLPVGAAGGELGGRGLAVRGPGSPRG